MPKINKNTLSAKQIKAISLMADPDEDVTHAEVGEAVGVRRETITAWKKNPVFLDRLVTESEKGFRSLYSRAMQKLNTKLQAGDWKAIELVLTRDLKYAQPSQPRTLEDNTDGILDGLAERLEANGTAGEVENVPGSDEGP